MIFTPRIPDIIDPRKWRRPRDGGMLRFASRKCCCCTLCKVREYDPMATYPMVRITLSGVNAAMCTHCAGVGGGQFRRMQALAGVDGVYDVPIAVTPGPPTDNVTCAWYDEFSFTGATEDRWAAPSFNCTDAPASGTATSTTLSIAMNLRGAVGETPCLAIHTLAVKAIGITPGGGLAAEWDLFTYSRSADTANRYWGDTLADFNTCVGASVAAAGGTASVLLLP